MISKYKFSDRLATYFITSTFVGGSGADYYNNEKSLIELYGI